MLFQNYETSIQISACLSNYPSRTCRKNPPSSVQRALIVLRDGKRPPCGTLRPLYQIPMSPGLHCGGGPQSTQN